MGQAANVLVVPFSVILSVPVNKRSMVFGTGSNGVKARLGLEDDIYFHDMSETTVAVYCYDKATMDEVLPKIKSLLLADVSFYSTEQPFAL